MIRHLVLAACSGLVYGVLALIALCLADYAFDFFDNQDLFHGAWWAMTSAFLVTLQYERGKPS